jgi:hypothetical protein
MLCKIDFFLLIKGVFQIILYYNEITFKYILVFLNVHSNDMLDYV